MNFYNDIDEGVCAWLRELIKAGLIPDGEVSSTSITELNPDDLNKYTQCHFFCGVAGWLEAFLLAGIDPRSRRWTGSCPCQPFSAAGSQEGQADARHLWPAFMRLIRVCRPDSVFGEQVEGAIGFGWLDGIQADLEAEGYAVGHCVLGAHSAGSPNIRQRLYWVAYAEGQREGPESGGAREGVLLADGCGAPSRMAYAHASERGTGGAGRNGSAGTDAGRKEGDIQSGADGEAGGVAIPESAGGCGRFALGDGTMQKSGGPSENSRLGYTGDPRPQGHWGPGRELDATGREDTQRHSGATGFWSRYDLIPCRDGKARRIESGVKPLVDGLPKGMVRVCDPSLPIDAQASAEGRVIRLKGYGNAINPHTAALFIRAAESARLGMSGRLSASVELEDLDA